LATAVYSLTNATGIKGAPIHWVGLDNYREFLFMGRASADNLAALNRTLIFCLAVTLIQFTLGLFIARLVNQKLKGTNLFRTNYFMPVI
jgi:raffinose/stachyose/melibiose transport system permease protein